MSRNTDINGFRMGPGNRWETQWEAYDSDVSERAQRNIILTDDATRTYERFWQEPTSYNQVRRQSFEIKAYGPAGTTTDQYWHVILTRLDNGIYELVNYMR